MIILLIVWIKNTVENVYWIFLKTTDKSYLVKFVLIMHNKSSQADIAHNPVIRCLAEQRTRTNQRVQTKRCKWYSCNSHWHSKVSSFHQKSPKHAWLVRGTATAQSGEHIPTTVPDDVWLGTALSALPSSRASTSGLLYALNSTLGLP